LNPCKCGGDAKWCTLETPQITFPYCVRCNENALCTGDIPDRARRWNAANPLPEPTTAELAATFAPEAPVKAAHGCVDTEKERPAWRVETRDGRKLEAVKSWKHTNITVGDGDWDPVSGCIYRHRRDDARADVARIKRERGIK
jgi:hypothetical protein